VISDGAEDRLPPAIINALDPRGGNDVLAIVKSLWSEPVDPATGVPQFDELVKVAQEEAGLPNDVTGIISFGLCGGLRQSAAIGQGFIYTSVATPDDQYFCESCWRERLFAVTKYYEARCWSSGEFNTANDPEQRKALWLRTGCGVIDDESRAVAEFAASRDILFAGLRVISDGAEDRLPPAIINALDPRGGNDVLAIVKSLWTEPIDPATGVLQFDELVKVAQEADFAMAELSTAMKAIGPYFQWLN
jgi:Phosphorylase superfamily